MDIKTRNKKSDQFSMASMSDLVFLLLIFFILVSTLISPNAIDLSLPSSDSKIIAPKGPVVAIDKYYRYYYGSTPVDLPTLEGFLITELANYDKTAVELQVDEVVPIAYVVQVYNIVSQINDLNNTKHKVILKTSPETK